MKSLKEPVIQRTYDWLEGFKACEKDNQEKVAELQEKSKDYCSICNKMNKCFGKGFCPFLKLLDDIDVLFGCEKPMKEVKEGKE